MILQKPLIDDGMAHRITVNEAFYLMNIPSTITYFQLCLKSFTDMFHTYLYLFHPIVKQTRWLFRLRFHQRKYTLCSIVLDNDTDKKTNDDDRPSCYMIWTCLSLAKIEMRWWYCCHASISPAVFSTLRPLVVASFLSSCISWSSEHVSQLTYCLEVSCKL